MFKGANSKTKSPRRGKTSRSPDLDTASSDSDVDSLTEDLDQIGRFNIPKFSAYLTKDNLLSLPNFPSFGNFPNMPQFPTFTSVSSAPNLPHFDLAEISKYIAQCVNNATSSAFSNSELEGFQSKSNYVNSVKTSIATRIQMNTFLSDLKSGKSLQAAIDRLQPITELVHEVISLPVEDMSEDESQVSEPDTEPVGVGTIVNREQPFVNNLVLPDADTIGGLLQPTQNKSMHRKRIPSKKSAKILSDFHDSSVCNTDLDSVDELTREETEALTHLNCLDDFFDEDMLRKKIQNIHSLKDLSQHSKNKLVTKLMMGNYYKYIHEKLNKNVHELVDADTNDSVIPATSQGHNGTPCDSKDCTERTSIPNYTSTDAKDVLPSVDEEYVLQNDDDIDMIDEDDEAMGEDEVVLTEEDTKPSYHDVEKGVLGCQHYQRNCKLECPTCYKWFPCRFCHDMVIADHKLSRSDVKHVLCMRCNTPQIPENNYCVNCEEELANYFCLKCVLYDNDPCKDIYHCDKCGICRLGLGLSKDYFHCDTCNICLSTDLKEHHKCVTNTTHCDCPICNEYLFTSVNKVVFMKCGHSIHQSCYDELIKHSYKCPICKKTVVNAETQFRILDQEIRQSALPPPYDKWRCIISCNDCKGKSNCSYHVMGLKCKYCASYNTNQLKIIKPEEVDDENDEGQEDDGLGEARLTSMRLVKTNLSSNFLIGDSNGDSTTENFEADKRSFDDYNSAYDGDDNENDGYDDIMSGMVNMERITKALLGERKVDGNSIRNIFQNIINATVLETGATNQSNDEMRMNNESIGSANEL